MSSIKKLLILPHIRIHNANALSSPYTIGFPAMTAWLGATHALQRNLNNKQCDINFDATGIVCHQMDLQTYRGENDFVSSIVGTGNPLDKTGARSAFIEEARCHLEISLVIEFSSIGKEQEALLLQLVQPLLHSKMKLAGGDIMGFQSPEIIRVEEGDDKDIARLTRKLMPGYAVIERRDLMIEAMKEQEEQETDALDALLDYLAVHHTCEKDDNGNVTWKSQRKQFNGKSVGWVVPVATGFHGVSELGEAKNQRDPDAPHRFAESIITLGEFKMPYRFNRVDDLLWRYQYIEESNLYLCQQAGQDPLDDSKEETIANEFY